MVMPFMRSWSELLWTSLVVVVIVSGLNLLNRHEPGAGQVG